MTPHRLRSTFQRLSALLLCLAVASPLLVIVSAAFYPPGALPTADQWWPEDPSHEAIKSAWELAELGPSLLFSTLLAALGAAFSVTVASMAAVGIHLLPNTSRQSWVGALVVAASIPYALLWLPRFLIFRELGLHNTALPLLGPGLIGGSPLLVLLYLHALSQRPYTPFEMARVEGLKPLSIWWKVGLPQLRSATLAVSVLSFVVFWGDVLTPLLYLQNSSWQTAPLALLGLELLGRGALSIWMAGALWMMMPLMLILLLRPWLRSALSR